MATQNLTINNSIIGTEGAQLLVLLLDQVPDMENPGHWGSRLKSLFDSEWVTGFSSTVDLQKYPFQSNILMFRILFEFYSICWELLSLHFLAIFVFHLLH